MLLQVHTLCLAFILIEAFGSTTLLGLVHFVWPSLMYTLTLLTHTCGAHTMLGSVVLLYIYTLVQSLLTLGLWTQLHCTTVHLLVLAWSLFCQPITEELRFTCFTLIGPLGVGWRRWSCSLIATC
jgi:hypothetical protein